METPENICPKCSRSDTASLQTVYEEGTATSNGTGLAIGTGGSELVVGASRSSSIQSQRAAPPARRSGTAALVAVSALIGAIIALCIGISRLASNDIHGDPAGPAIVISLLFAAASLGAFFVSLDAARFNRNEWLIRYARWQSSWMCRRCGTIFENK